MDDGYHQPSDFPPRPWAPARHASFFVHLLQFIEVEDPWWAGAMVEPQLPTRTSGGSKMGWKRIVIQWL